MFGIVFSCWHPITYSKWYFLLIILWEAKFCWFGSTTDVVYMKLLFICTIFPEYLCNPSWCLAVEQSLNACTYIKAVRKIPSMQGLIYVSFSIHFSEMLTYVSYYIPANQSNGFRHTLKCFTELRTKQVIQTIPSLELCCGSADSFWVVESLTLLVVMHFIEYPFKEHCLFISQYLYLLFLN